MTPPRTPGGYDPQQMGRVLEAVERLTITVNDGFKTINDSFVAIRTDIKTLSKEIEEIRLQQERQRLINKIIVGAVAVLALLTLPNIGSIKSAFTILFGLI